jgi:AAA+ ATPase superfamily predicted ATPase
MGKLKNPFRYGIAVDSPYFIDREQEIRDYTKWLTSGQSLVIYSPRRYGKTSLVLKLLKEIRKKGYNTIYIDFFKINSRQRFAELYYTEILRQLPSWEKALKQISSLTRSLRPVISIDQQGLPSVSLKSEGIFPYHDLTELLDLPQKLSDKKNWVIVFDEFQEINRLNGDSFEKEMRSAFIHHKNVGYAFLGSKMHMLLNMFTHESKAFYQFGKIVELKKLPEDIFAEYIESGLKKSGIDFKDGISAKIIHICEGIPHYVQYLASGAWEEAIENKSKLDGTVLELAIFKILINQSDFFSVQYERLTLHQQTVLRAISVDNENIYNSDFARKYNLKSPSSVQRSVERLLNDGILIRQHNSYHFTDPFFRRWVLEL